MKEIITFIVPMYNSQGTVEKTLQSVIEQTSSLWKVIIVDDGSFDDSAKIAKKFVKRYPDKIRYVYEKNRGLGGARNNGMQLVDTEYVAFLDSDDILMSNYVETVNKNVMELDSRQLPQMIMVLPVRWNCSTDEYLDWMDKNRFEKLFAQDGDVIDARENLSLFQTEVNVCRKILNVKWLRQLDFKFREKIKWEDVVPHFFLLSQCERCMGLISTGFYYRIGLSTQITAQRNTDRMDIIPVLSELFEYSESIQNENMYMPVMRINVRFSIWCIRMTDGKVRKNLVKALHNLYVSVPKKYYVALREGSKAEYSRKNSLMYRLFMIGIRYKVFNFVFSAAWIQKCAEVLLRTVLHAKGAVE